MHLALPDLLHTANRAKLLHCCCQMAQLFKGLKDCGKNMGPPLKTIFKLFYSLPSPWKSPSIPPLVLRLTHSTWHPCTASRTQIYVGWSLFWELHHKLSLWRSSHKLSLWWSCHKLSLWWSCHKLSLWESCHKLRLCSANSMLSFWRLSKNLEFWYFFEVPPKKDTCSNP